MAKTAFPILAVLGLLLPLPECSAQNGAIGPQQFIRLSGAFSGNQSVSSVTLTGVVHRIAGSTNETGQVTLAARADGSSSLELNLDSAERAEIQDAFANGHGCSWTGSDGGAHVSPAHNCVIPFAWFLPHVALFSPARPPDGAMTFSSAGDGRMNLHWTNAPPADASAEVANLLGHIRTYDLRFDPATLLPVELLYALHPDKAASVDIPVRVEYSDYRTIDGAAIPFHIQRYFNGVLSLDITLTNAVVTH